MRLLTSAFLLGILIACPRAEAGLIYWVGDNGPEGAAGAGMFSDPQPGPADHGFIELLQAAGHHMIRYNPPNSGPLPQGDIDQLNTADLVILGRAITSTPFQASGANVQAPQWNAAVRVPLLTINAYLARANRLGWFQQAGTAPNQEDSPGTELALVNPAEPRTAFLFEGVTLNGQRMANPYNLREASVSRGTSQLLDAPVAGGEVLATATFLSTDGSPSTPVTAPVIVSIPAGTPVRGGADVLGGYRLYFAAGSREVSGQQPTQAGILDLTPDGQAVFQRAVTLALRSGSPPRDIPDPALTIVREGAEVVVSWQGFDWALEQSNDLRSWSGVPTPQSPARLSVEGPQRFYRLIYSP